MSVVEATQETVDPFAPQPQTFANGPIFGEVTWTVWDCVLQKGAKGGKAPFDQNIHDARRKLLCITLTVTPLEGTDSSQYLPQWDMLRDVGPEWAKFVLPSLKDIGLNTWAEVTSKVKYAKIERAKTGESYPHKTKVDDNGSPVMVDKTYPKFVAFYADEAECRKAYEAENGVIAVPTAAPTNGNSTAPTLTPRDTALAFIKVWVKKYTTTTKDFETVTGLLDAEINKYPNVSAHYNITSQPVLDLLTDAGVSIPF